MARLMLLLMVVAPMILISQAATNQNVSIHSQFLFNIDNVTLDHPTLNRSKSFRIKE